MLENITFTPEFESALKAMNDGVSPLFVTGNAGTGKSTLLREFCKGPKRIAVLAPTGMAAILIEGATIHSFFGFRPGIPLENLPAFDESRASMLGNLETLVIDEISMVRVDLLDAIDLTLQEHRKNTLPFGGVQVILIGDICQLPPVVSKADERKYLAAHYRSPYFFSANVMQRTGLNVALLTHPFRQDNPEFLQILNEIRTGQASDLSLSVLNQRTEYVAPPSALILTSRNDEADNANSERLKRIDGDSVVFTATIKGRVSEEDYPADRELRLKRGAQVMLLRNTDADWMNGTIAILEEFDENTMSLRHPDPRIGTRTVERVCWDIMQYAFDPTTKGISQRVAGTFEQFPVRLAWAITTHKSQGQTFNNVAIDLGRGAFSHGQVYVALSRAKTLEGIYLAKAVSWTDLRFDQRISDFLNLIDAGGSIRCPDNTPLESIPGITPIERGSILFRALAQSAQSGNPIGIGYADFSAIIHGHVDYRNLEGRSYEARQDTPRVLGLAKQITDSVGRISVQRGNSTVATGMDSYIWGKNAERNDAAFKPGREFSPPYTKQQWQAVFPDGQRSVLSAEQILGIFFDVTTTL